MSKNKCKPVTLPEPCDDIAAACELNDKAYLLAYAFLKSAEWAIACAELPCFERTEIQFGPTRSDALCCETLAVGILPARPEKDGTCFFNFPATFEVLISRCKPHRDGDGTPVPSGSLDGCDTTTVNGHSLFMSRQVEAIQKLLLKNLCCFLDDESCALCCQKPYYIQSIDFDSSGECAQVRFFITNES